MAMRGRGRLLRGATRKSATPQGPVDPRGTLAALRGATCTWDLATDALTWGSNAAEILGIPHIGLYPTGSALAEAVEPGCGPGRREAIHSAEIADEGTGVPYAARYTLRTKTDRFVLVEETGRWFADAQGHPSVAHALLRVVSNTVRQEGLNAGLKARAALLSQIVDDVVEAQRSRHSLTLVVGAFDVGDDDSEAVMAEVARRVRPLMRRRDRFAAYGSTRFALALASCPGAEAEAATRRILSLIAEPATDDHIPVRNLRLGAASAPDHAVDAPELLHRAEEALASAEARGQGSALYDSTLAGSASAAPVGTTAADIIDALNGRGLVLALDHAIDARSRTAVFAHARPCLVGPDGTVRPAGDLETAAAREGLSLLLEARVLELAADHLAACPRERVAIRVSPESLQGSEWLPMLAAHLGARPGIESRLVVDVPERALAALSVRGRLDAMKALGVATMVSGFGTGTACLKHLGVLPIDMLRLEGAFVQALSTGIEVRQHVRNLAELAQHFGIIAVAEGVDSEPAARLLAAWGIDCLQGAVAGSPTVLGGPNADLRRFGTA